MRRLHLAYVAAVFASGIGSTPGFAQETRYIDDRSDAASLVRSLYNAINRKEFARAWDYFGDTKPASDFDSFVKGYEGTQAVKVITGAVSSEGAAGSTFFSVPVAIAATGADGQEQVFAGCYTARLVSPQLQEQNFQPLHLEKGALKPMPDHAIDDAVPEQCPDAPAPDKAQAVLDRAKAAFAATHGGRMHVAARRRSRPRRSRKPIRSRYRHKSSAEDEPEQHARLFRFFCSMGAYNESHIYYLHKEIEGLQELHFATPEVDIRYENDDTEGKVESVAIIGYRADAQLVNSFYDDATKSISSHAKWRGVGDASSSGLWIFRDGDFTLVRYDVDASYDGEINPETVLDYDTAPRRVTFRQLAAYRQHPVERLAPVGHADRRAVRAGLEADEAGRVAGRFLHDRRGKTLPASRPETPGRGCPGRRTPAPCA